MFFVLDGRHLTPAALAASWTMLFGPGPDGRAATGIVIGIGDPSDLR